MSLKEQRTPKDDGFWMPGEFEPISGLYMLLPYRGDIWRQNARFAQLKYVELANKLADYTDIYLGIYQEVYESVLDLLKGSIKTFVVDYIDAWARDTGPTFVVNELNDLKGIEWGFNAWGGKEEGLYDPWDLDNEVAFRIIRHQNVDSYRKKDFIFEGGSIHVDGEGTLITTKECLLSPNRNPHLTQPSVETTLCNYLNVNKIIWLEQGLYGDETNGHVDNVCCFARPGEVIIAWTDDRENPNYQICRGIYETLCSSTDAKGRKLKIHKLPLPSPVYITEEEYQQIEHNPCTKSAVPYIPLPTSYVNFIFCNDLILVPIFGDPMDEVALSIIKDIFPDKVVDGFDSREILLGGGNIHCITQQIPERRKRIK